MFGAIAFTISYLALGIAAAWAMDAMGLDSIWLHYLFGVVIAGGAAILIALAIGRLTAKSVVLCSLGLQIGVFLVSVAILAAIPYRAGSPIDWSGIFGTLATQNILLSVIIAVASSFMWLIVFRRIAPGFLFSKGHAPN